MHPTLWGLMNDQQVKPSCALQNELSLRSWEVSSFKRYTVACQEKTRVWEGHGWTNKHILFSSSKNKGCDWAETAREKRKIRLAFCRGPLYTAVFSQLKVIFLPSACFTSCLFAVPSGIVGLLPWHWVSVGNLPSTPLHFRVPLLSARPTWS